MLAYRSDLPLSGSRRIDKKPRFSFCRVLFFKLSAFLAVTRSGRSTAIFRMPFLPQERLAASGSGWEMRGEDEGDFPD